MEKTKRAINKLFVVVALVLTIALCCALFGCGEKMKDATSNQDTSPIVTEPAEDDIYTTDIPLADYPRSVYGINYSGLCMRVDIEEKEEYDIDDVTVELLYGIDIERFNFFAKEKKLNETVENGCICVSAFNIGDPYYSGYTYSILGETLQNMENYDVKDGAFLIDTIPCITTDTENKYLCADNLYGTEYEGSVIYDPYLVTCYKKCSVTLPSELFTTEVGYVLVGLYAYAICDDEFEFVIEDNYAHQYFNAFSYRKTGDKITLFEAYFGGRYVFDGTASVSM